MFLLYSKNLRIKLRGSKGGEGARLLPLFSYGYFLEICFNEGRSVFIFMNKIIVFRCLFRNFIRCHIIVSLI